MTNLPTDGEDQRTILIIEDDEIVLKTLTLQLIDRGWNLYSASTHAEATNLCEEYPHAIVLVGTGLEQLDGVLFARSLKSANHERIVIAMTGYPSINQLLEGLSSEMFDYLVKPFRLEQLDMVIERAGREIALHRENDELKRQIKILQGELTISRQPPPTPVEKPPTDVNTGKPSGSAANRDNGPNAIASYERQIRSSLLPKVHRAPAAEPETESKKVASDSNLPPGLED